jgi:hypothetical protein
VWRTTEKEELDKEEKARRDKLARGSKGTGAGFPFPHHRSECANYSAGAKGLGRDSYI